MLKKYYGKSQMQAVMLQQMEQMMGGLQQGLSMGLRPKEYTDLRKEEIPIVLSDNTVLNCTLVMPKRAGRWPVILIRGPYVNMKVVNEFAVAPCFAERGYAVALVDVRGAVDSEGEWSPMVNERRDGREVIDWIGKQEWCDGNIGCWGASYLGYTQWSIADYDHPMLKTLYVSVSGDNGYKAMYRRGMAKRDVWSVWAAQMMDDNRYYLFQGEEGKALRKQAIEQNPAIELDCILKGKECSWYREWMTNDRPDDTYWQTGFWKEMYDSAQNIKIHLLIHAGYFDIFYRTEWDTYQRLPEDVRRKSRFIIGPWTHSGMAASGMEFPNENRQGLMLVKGALEWFDHQLKGMPYTEPNGCMETYVVGTGKWHIWDTQMKADEVMRYYFNMHDKTLKMVDSGERTKISYVYDPKDPVMMVGGCQLSNPEDENISPVGAVTQPVIGYREDVISFTTDVMEKDRELAGIMKVHLFVSSTAEATAFSIKVMEMKADGVSINICDDITDIRFTDEDVYSDYRPGEIRELILEMPMADWKIERGSKIRVDISSSNFPEFHVHQNLAKKWAETSESIVATQTLYGGADTASYIEIPFCRCE